VKECWKLVHRKLVHQKMVQWAAAMTVVACLAAGAQTTYQPKFKGDPAKSDSEAAALGYMRTVLRAQKQYKKKNDKFATSLADLVHTGSFTKRMVNPDRGDYSVGFKPSKDKDKDGFDLTMTPKQLDAEHRSFYAGEDGVIHGDDQGPANEKSPVVK
jgi:type II secretory pathway pseudopilin PulG